MELNRIWHKLSAVVVTSMLSSVSLAQVDTSEYGAWNDVLTPEQAQGRFEWLNRCYKDLLVETWDQMNDPTELIPADEKVDRLKQAWLYRNGQEKANPSYITFGDSNHQNPKNWYAGKEKNATCTTIPVDYKMMGLMTSLSANEYCAIESLDGEYEWIKKVEFGSYSSESGARTYTNFSGRIIKANAGANYDIKLTPDFSEDAFGETWHVWIDWNSDGDFKDSGELLFEDTSSTTITKRITVPADAAKGFTKMRITMDVLGGKEDSCANIQYGEVEDYTILIN